LLVVLHLLLQDAVADLLADSLHPLQLLPSDALLRDAEALSAGAAGGLREVLQEVSGNADGFQLRQLGFLHGRQIVLLENLILGSQRGNEIQQPTLIRDMRFINASENKVLVSAYPVKLPQQNINSGRSRTWQHLDLSVLGAICFSRKNIPHVLLSDNRRLILRQVVSIALHRLVEVLAVLDDA